MKFVFFGDSVTEGCFELSYPDPQCTSYIETKDTGSVYHNVLLKTLKDKYPQKSFDFINAGVRGDTALQGFARMETDVVAHQPDVTVVAFGLNDIGDTDLEEYGATLEKIFVRLKEVGSKVIYMTQNMMNTYVHPDALELLYPVAKETAELQNSNRADEYFNKGKEIAQKHDVYVADAYSVWKKLWYYGIDVTVLLSNRINHPNRSMHRLFADVLFECMERHSLI